MLKAAALILAISLAAGITGCNRGNDKIGGAPRTESASSLAGWKDISSSGIAIRLPSDWKLMDFSKETFDKAADRVLGNDPKFAAMRTQVSAIAKSGLIKLFAFEPPAAGGQFGTNCNVAVQDVPGSMTLEQVVSAAVQQIAPMVANGTQPKVEYLSLKAGKTAVIRSEIQSPNPAIPTLVSIAFINLKGSKLASVTFSAPLSEEARIRKVADQAMDGFRYTE